MKPILCLDFDGVCHSYVTGWHGIDVIPDPPVPGLFEFLVQACQVFDVQIFSSRSATLEGRGAMAEWFDLERQKWRNLTGNADAELSVSFPPKMPPAFLTIDDRAVTFTGTWPDVAELSEFTPWNK